MSRPYRLGSVSGERAFTLVELLTSLSIMALLGALCAAAPVRSLSAGWRAREAASAVLGVLRKARWLALTENREYSVTFLPPEPGGPWRALLQRRETGDWHPAEAPASLPPSISTLAVIGQPRKEFNPDGSSSSGSVVIACRGGSAWRISLTAATGRIRIYRERVP